MRIIGIVALVFGLVTVVAGGRALFGDEAARAAVGAAVPFVLWFNFAAGFAYVVAGIGLLMQSPWAAWLSALIAAATLLVQEQEGSRRQTVDQQRRQQLRQQEEEEQRATASCSSSSRRTARS